MKTIKLAISVLFMILLSGCAAQQKLMDGIMSSWAGSNVNEVIAQWGLPHERMEIGGTEYFTWHHQKSAMLAPATSRTRGSAYGTTYGNSVNITGTSTTTYKPATVIHGGCDRILGVQNETVVTWRWGGNNCPFVEAMEYSSWRRR